jgi:L-serine dehydratase
MLSAFEIIGPPMVGPSSSHTAGACRIGLMARRILAEEPRRVMISLHGSFAATGQGHATDRALVAGVLGFLPDDERLKDALDLAPQQGLEITFEEVDLGEQMHPNSVRLALEGDTATATVTGSSVGGGSIVICQIDDNPVDIRGTLETVVMWHRDTPGFLGRVVSVCACVELNIATLRTSRHERGESALTTLEIDGHFDADLLSVLRRSKGMQRLAHIPVLPGF